MTTPAERIVSAILDGDSWQPELPLGDVTLPDPSEIAVPSIERWKKERAAGKIVYDHSVSTHGVMLSCYWQGAGVSYTRWDDVGVGTGENAYEAMNDALDQLAQQGWDVGQIPNEFDENSPDNVQNVVRDANPDLEPDEDGTVDTEDSYYYVTVYVQGIPAGGAE